MHMCKQPCNYGHTGAVSLNSEHVNFLDKILSLITVYHKIILSVMMLGFT